MSAGTAGETLICVGFMLIGIAWGNLELVTAAGFFLVSVHLWEITKAVRGRR